jgi:hypothetical protein
MLFKREIDRSVTSSAGARNFTERGRGEKRRQQVDPELLAVTAC